MYQIQLVILILMRWVSPFYRHKNRALRGEITNWTQFCLIQRPQVLITSTHFLLASQSHNKGDCPGHTLSPSLSGKIFHPSRPSRMPLLWHPSTVHNFLASSGLPQKFVHLISVALASWWGTLVFPVRCQKLESWNVVLLIVDTQKLGAWKLLEDTRPRHHSQGFKFVWSGLQPRYQHFGNSCNISNVFIIIIFVTVACDQWSMMLLL